MFNTWYAYFHEKYGYYCFEEKISFEQKEEMYDSPYIKEIIELKECRDKSEAQFKLEEFLYYKAKNAQFELITSLKTEIKYFERRYHARAKEGNFRIADHLRNIINLIAQHLEIEEKSFKEAYNGTTEVKIFSSPFAGNRKIFTIER